MPIAINYKICDNSSECPGIAACTSKALDFNSEDNQLEVDNLKCKTCGACVSVCEIGAIRLAKDDDELKKVESEIEADPRKTSDLFVDRYGAQPVLETFLTSIEGLSSKLEKTNKIVAVELFNDDSIECLLYSNPIKDLFEISDYEFCKVDVKDRKEIQSYMLNKLPSLLIFEGNELKGVIEGYFSNKEKEELKMKVKEILEEK